MLMLFNQQGWLLKPAWQDTVWKRSKNRILPDLRDEQKKGMTLKCCEQLDKKLQAENGPKGKEVLKHSCFADLGMMRKTPGTKKKSAPENLLTTKTDKEMHAYVFTAYIK